MGSVLGAAYSRIEEALMDRREWARYHEQRHCPALALAGWAGRSKVLEDILGHRADNTKPIVYSALKTNKL